MNEIIKKIINLRSKEFVAFDETNINRYSIVVKEADGTKTAYYFSSPIYNSENDKLIDLLFTSEKDNVMFIGSNCSVCLEKNNVKFLQENCVCELYPKDSLGIVSKDIAEYGEDLLSPTLNGILYRGKGDNSYTFSLDIKIHKKVLNISSNGKYLALMKNEKTPLMAISCLGAKKTGDGELVPAFISYKEKEQGCIEITIHSEYKCGCFLFEVNLYEPKLFQDTTVESCRLFDTNVYGTTAFVGNTDESGEQWLYSRIDMLKIPELFDKRIKKAVCHFPIYSEPINKIEAYEASERFCTFTCNWNNKPSIQKNKKLKNESSKGNYHVDVSGVLFDRKTGKICSSDGTVICPKEKGVKPIAISTGDSCAYPQILEVNYT